MFQMGRKHHESYENNIKTKQAQTCQLPIASLKNSCSHSTIVERGVISQIELTYT